MNKIKLIYDVVKTMKEKDILTGTLKAEGLKDDERGVIRIQDIFEKNNLTRKTKAKIKSEVDSDGKKMKMDNVMEFEGKDFHGHHGFMKHGHCHHHGHHFGQNPDENSGGFKGGLNKLAFALSILNNLKVEENEDKSIVLFLTLADIPEELKKMLKEKRQHGNTEHENHHHHSFMKEFHDVEKTILTLPYL